LVVLRILVDLIALIYSKWSMIQNGNLNWSRVGKLVVLCSVVERVKTSIARIGRVNYIGFILRNFNGAKGALRDTINSKRRFSWIFIIG